MCVWGEGGQLCQRFVCCLHCQAEVNAIHPLYIFFQNSSHTREAVGRAPPALQMLQLGKADVWVPMISRTPTPSFTST